MPLPGCLANNLFLFIVFLFIVLFGFIRHLFTTNIDTNITKMKTSIRPHITFYYILNTPPADGRVCDVNTSSVQQSDKVLHRA